METVCAVVGCDSKWSEFTDLEFFRVTTNKKLLPLWQEVVKLNISQNARICSLHFKEEDVTERGGEKRLKIMVVPSYNIVQRPVKKKPSPVKESDDDTDEENLLTVRKTLMGKQNDIIMKIEKTTPTKPSMDFTCKRRASPYIIHVEYHGNTRSIGTQVCLKTENEVLLKRKLKTLNQRVKRREERVTYLQTVLKMIKKNVKGTDIANKLNQELENISANFHIEEIDFNKKKIKEENLGTDYNSDEEMNDDGQFVSDKGSFVEVALSPNLKRYG